MQTQSQIESFFSSLDFDWQDLIEFLPVGVIFFDDNWKIKSVNRNFLSFFEDEWNFLNIEGMNLFSKNILSDKLPLKEVLKLKEGQHFEKKISFYQGNNKSIKLLFKGSPILKEGIFQGGTLIVEDQNSPETNPTSLLSSSNSISNFLLKICKCFLVTDLDGNIQIAPTDESSNLSYINNIKGKNIRDVFSTFQNTDLIEVIKSVASENISKSFELIYFHENEKITYNSVFVPLNNSQKSNFVVVLLKETDSKTEDSISYLSNSLKLKEFEQFAKVGTDGLFKLNSKGEIIYWADNSTSLFGFEEHEILLEFIGKVFPEINKSKFEEIKKFAISNTNWEDTLSTSISKVVQNFNVKIIPKKVADEIEFYVYCNRINLQQQKINSAVEEERQFFKDTVIKSNQMILQVSPIGTILFSNDKFGEKFGFEVDEIRGALFTDLIEQKFKDLNSLTNFEELLKNRELDYIPITTKIGDVIKVSFNLHLSAEEAEQRYFTIYFREEKTKDDDLVDTADIILNEFEKPVAIINKKNIVKVNSSFISIFGEKFKEENLQIPLEEIIDPLHINTFNNFLLSEFLEEKISTVFIGENGITFQASVKKISNSRGLLNKIIIIKPNQEALINTDGQSEQIKKQIGKNDSYFWSGYCINEEVIIEYIDLSFIKSIGFKEENLRSTSNFLEHITHPDDREKVKEVCQKLLNEKNNDQKDINYRIINRAGEVVWINNHIKIDFNDESDKVNLFGSITDVTDWTLEREELKSIINELDKLNTAKEKFISIISHDLKSPFTSIVGFSELILTDTTLSKEEIIEFVGHIKDASLHTVDLLNGLLDLTKLQTGRIEVEPKIISANYLATKSVEILSGLAFQKGLSLESEVDKSFFITADDNLILQVFNNLVANSIKFTPKGGSIKIVAHELPEEQKIEFRVIDNGVGMEQSDLEKLFVLDRKFTTLGTDGERGTGLGLNLVKEIIDKHHGKIYVKSEVGKGSEFVFTLPVSSPSILIVDGVQAERVVYSKLIESITDSIEVLQASNKAEALKIVKEQMPMLIIFEHKLPNMMGDEFIGEIVKSELAYHPSLIVLTKEYSEDLRKSYMDVGAHHVFSKPFDLKEFKMQLDKLTGNMD